MKPRLSEFLVVAHSQRAAVFEGYLDESDRRENGIRIFTMAGWLAHGDVWREFEEAWDTVRNAPQFFINEFKASDCEQGKNEFSGWSIAKRDYCRDRFLAIIEAFPRLVACAVVMTIDESAGRLKYENGPYIAASVYCMEEMTAMMAGERIGERVCYIFDEKNKVPGEVEIRRRQLKNDSYWNVSSRIGPATFEDSQNYSPLQAADFLAYEVYRHRYAQLVDASGPTRRWYPPPEAKLESYRVLHWDRETLLTDISYPSGRPIDPSLFR